MEVICLHDEAFNAIIDEVVSRIRTEVEKPEPRWIRGEEAMAILGITSKTTLQKWRDEGKIRFSQPEKKIILYDRESILAYIERHAQNTF